MSSGSCSIYLIVVYHFDTFNRSVPPAEVLMTYRIRWLLKNAMMAKTKIVERKHGIILMSLWI